MEGARPTSLFYSGFFGMTLCASRASSGWFLFRFSQGFPRAALPAARETEDPNESPIHRA